jgi:hypothetical protein
MSRAYPLCLRGRQGERRVEGRAADGRGSGGRGGRLGGVKMKGERGPEDPGESNIDEDLEEKELDGDVNVEDSGWCLRGG